MDKYKFVYEKRELVETFENYLEEEYGDETARYPDPIEIIKECANAEYIAEVINNNLVKNPNDYNYNEKDYIDSYVNEYIVKVLEEFVELYEEKREDVNLIEIFKEVYRCHKFDNILDYYINQGDEMGGWVYGNGDEDIVKMPYFNDVEFIEEDCRVAKESFERDKEEYFMYYLINYPLEFIELNYNKTEFIKEVYPEHTKEEIGKMLDKVKKINKFGEKLMEDNISDNYAVRLCKKFNKIADLLVNNKAIEEYLKTDTVMEEESRRMALGLPSNYAGILKRLEAMDYSDFDIERDEFRLKDEVENLYIEMFSVIANEYNANKDTEGLNKLKECLDILEIEVENENEVEIEEEMEFER